MGGLLGDTLETPMINGYKILKETPQIKNAAGDNIAMRQRFYGG